MSPSRRPVLKLKNRLSTLASMVTQQYDHIWDCCCDHGHLGMELLQSDSFATVHFVDVVEPLIDALRDKLQTQFPDTHKWTAHCADLNQLILPETGSKHLLIIAGVGGDLIIQFVRKILSNNPKKEIEFLLCPVRHNFKARQAMKDLGLKLINESLVIDKGLFYEVIHIGPNADAEIEAIGSLMWDLANPDHEKYLEQKINHYQRAARSNSRFTEVFLAYQALKPV